MNKWNEFDYIKTPESWKNITIKQSRKTQFRLSFVVTAIILCLSLTTVAAYHSEIEKWLNTYFQKENVHKVNNIYKLKNENMQWISYEDALFAYEYEEKNDIEFVKQVYLVKDHQLYKMNSSIMKGQYQNKVYSFEYVIYKNDIFTFNHQGIIQYTLPYIRNQKLYMMTSDFNMISLNMKTKEIQQITKDNQSVNPIMSPNCKTILINKNNQYWTVYDIENQTEKKVKDIDGYALNNEIYFIDDYTVSTYHTIYYQNSETTKMYVINLKTQEKKIYDDITEFASPITIDKKDHLLIIKNILTNEHYSLKTDFKDAGYYLTRNYILFFSNDIKTTQSTNDIGYLYNIGKNKVFEIQMPKDIGDISEITIIDETKELLITDDKNFYFIDISHLF